MGETAAGSRWVTLLASLAVAATALLTAPAAAGASAAALEACARTAVTSLGYGLPPAWEVRTEVNEDGGAAWHRAGDTAVRGWRLQSDVHGLGVKDDRLVAPAFVATARSEVSFHHGYSLIGAARGVLEISTDGGASWEHVDGSALGGHPYTDGAGGTAFTGVQPDLISTVVARTSVDLAPWEGEEVLLSWRLLVDAPPAAPGWWALDEATFRAVADVECVAGSRPDRRCTTSSQASFSRGLPEGWEVDTAVNASGTAPWQTRFDPPFTGAVTDASGLAAKDDSLLTPPFVATKASSLRFLHRFLLEVGRDGGVLEVTTDDGATWEPVEADAFLLGRYQGTLANGRAAWTGSHVAGEEPASWSNFASVHVDLSSFDGQRIRVRWRLLADDVRVDALPGQDWFLGSPAFSEVIWSALCDPGGGTALETCSSLAPPAELSLQGITDDGAAIRMAVRVAIDVEEGPEIALLERTDPEEAALRMAGLEQEMRTALQPMEEAYSALGIGVDLTFDLLAPLDEEGAPRARDHQSDTSVVGSALDDSERYYTVLFRLAKEQYGHRPPSGTDLVYVASDLDLGGPAGVADCVGGIAYPHYSFAVGVVRGWWGERAPALIAAHEIGHLLGAHHHLANCGEALVPSLASTDPFTGRCTLMSPDVGLIWPRFSSVNAAIVRGYVEAYLGDDPQTGIRVMEMTTR